jgi:hypothetical protein
MKTRNPQFSLSTLILLSVSCSVGRKDIPINSLKDVLANLAPRPKTFEIDPTEGTILKGDKGTTIYIPAEIFRFEDSSLSLLLSKRE